MLACLSALKRPRDHRDLLATRGAADPSAHRSVVYPNCSVPKDRRLSWGAFQVLHEPGFLNSLRLWNRLTPVIFVAQNPEGGEHEHAAQVGLA